MTNIVLRRAKRTISKKQDCQRLFVITIKGKVIFLPVAGGTFFGVLGPGAVGDSRVYASSIGASLACKRANSIRD